ncbi:cytochrome c [Prosthecobacter sp.]|uniref:SorB family sulfite dehydrogenase c-type cytochrome subunit n=1 Tax=Prosthecobacter sp. TaxID=1965333 RepID=UPI0037835774
MNKIFLSLLLIAASAARISAADKTAAAGGEPDFSSFVWPVESGTYKPGAGVELAQGLCITCHSTEYVSTQPPLPRKFWEATVKKMKDKYAAPLPEDNTALIDYLTNAYGVK